MAEQNYIDVQKVKDEPSEYDMVEDRGLFDLAKRKEDANKETEFAEEFEEKVNVSEPPQQEKNDGVLRKLHEKLHRSGSSSSSSSSDEEEYEENGEKKKRKKGLKDKIKAKISNHKEKKEEKEEEKKEEHREKEEEKREKKEEKREEDTYVPIEKYDEDVVAVAVSPQEEEKKGLMEKIKEKLPGHKKSEETVEVVETVEVAPPPPPAPEEQSVEVDVKEKKGFLEKIKEKLPGFSNKQEEEKK